MNLKNKMKTNYKKFNKKILMKKAKKMNKSNNK